MVIRKASKNEIEQVIDFYYKSIDDMSSSPYHPHWKKDIYPDRKYLSDAVNNEELFIALRNEMIVGAMIINPTKNEDYNKIDWPNKFNDSEVMLIHTLCVLPKLNRQGIGRELVEHAINYANELGLKALRLDIIDGNYPAQKLYEATGFKFVTTLDLYYEDTGLYKFHIFELVI